MGAAPTHLDSHHNVHWRPTCFPDFLTVAKDTPAGSRLLAVRYVPDFYGQRRGKDGSPTRRCDQPDCTSENRVDEGLTELGCHPGYVDSDFVSRYTAERECEVRTLCDPRVREAIREAGSCLVSFRDVPAACGARIRFGGSHCSWPGRHFDA